MDVTAGRLAFALGSLAGVALVLVEDSFHPGPAILVALGLGSLLAVVVLVNGLEISRRADGFGRRDQRGD